MSNRCFSPTIEDLIALPNLDTQEDFFLDGFYSFNWSSSLWPMQFFRWCNRWNRFSFQKKLAGVIQLPHQKIWFASFYDINQAFLQTGKRSGQPAMFWRWEKSFFTTTDVPIIKKRGGLLTIAQDVLSSPWKKELDWFFSTTISAQQTGGGARILRFFPGDEYFEK